MYNAEVLSKFPVVQHFPFGSLFSWDQDPNATPIAPSVHTTSQPVGRSTPSVAGTARPPPQESTKAPWAYTPVARVSLTAAPWAQAPTTQTQSRQGPTRAPGAGGRGGKLPMGDASSSAMPSPSKMPDGPARAPWADKGSSGGG